MGSTFVCSKIMSDDYCIVLPVKKLTLGVTLF